MIQLEIWIPRSWLADKSQKTWHTPLPKMSVGRFGGFFIRISRKMKLFLRSRFFLPASRITVRRRRLTFFSKFAFCFPIKKFFEFSFLRKFAFHCSISWSELNKVNTKVPDYEARNRKRLLSAPFQTACCRATKIRLQKLSLTLSLRSWWNSKRVESQEEQIRSWIKEKHNLWRFSCENPDRVGNTIDTESACSSTWHTELKYGSLEANQSSLI